MPNKFCINLIAQVILLYDKLVNVNGGYCLIYILIESQAVIWNNIIVTCLMRCNQCFHEQIYIFIYFQTYCRLSKFIIRNMSFKTKLTSRDRSSLEYHHNDDRKSRGHNWPTTFWSGVYTLISMINASVSNSYRCSAVSSIEVLLNELVIIKKLLLDRMCRICGLWRYAHLYILLSNPHLKLAGMLLFPPLDGMAQSIWNIILLWAHLWCMQNVMKTHGHTFTGNQWIPLAKGQ